MADGGELTAFFRGAQDGVAQAVEDAGGKLGDLGDETMQNVLDSLATSQDAEDANTRLIDDIRPGPGDTGSGGADSGGADSGAAPGPGEPGRITQLLNTGDGGTADAGAGDGRAAGLSEASEQGPAAARSAPETDTAGDPVDVATGDVLLAQADVSLPGVLPAVIERVHRSSHRTGRWLGTSWLSAFDQRLEVHPDRLIGAFADGRILTWPRAASGDGAGDGAGLLPEHGPAWPLWRDGEGWTVTDRQQGLTWRFERRSGYWWSGLGGGQGELPLVSVTDRAGHAITFEYGDAGEPVAVARDDGSRIAVTVGAGRITELTLGGVPLVSYSYDADGQLAGVVNSSGEPLRFSYDEAGRLTGWTDRNGYSYRYSYDEAGRCVRGQSPAGALSGAFEYEPGVTRWTDNAGAVTVYEIGDAAAKVVAVTDPVGSVTRFGHDERGRVTARTDPLGRVTRYAYDDRGNLVAVTRPDGTAARAEYDERCLPVLLTEPDGAVWRQAYDERGNRTEVIAPDGTVTRYAYDLAGHLASVTGADGAVTTVTCGTAGLPAAVTAPDGTTTRYERDQFGRVGRVTGPDGGVTSLAWTVEGLPAARTLPDGAIETWAWDSEGNLLRHVSAAGAVTAYEYGPFDKVTAMVWPDGTRTSFGYDHEQRVTSVTHGGLTWSYSYDAAGRLTAETDYNGAVTRYSRDAAGQVIRRVNAAGQEMSFSYDVLGNLTGQSSGEAVTTFGYDAGDRLIRARNADAELTLEYDALGRVIAETCNGRTVRTWYDASGRVTARVTPAGAGTAWAYNTAALPSVMTAAGRQLRFGYGPDGLETRREMPGSVVLEQGWDARGRLASQTLTGPGTAAGPGPEGPALPGQLLQRRGYAYNPDGFVTGTEDLLTGSREFRLDAAGRITTISGPEWSERYAYDPAGNVSGAVWPALPSSLADGWLDAGAQGTREITGTIIARAGNVRYRHDAAGRVVARSRSRISRKPETWRYEWDADNRLVAVTTPDGSVWRYRYDPLGRRIAKEHVSASGEPLGETRFSWDGAVLAEQSDIVGDGREQVTTWDYQPGTFAPLAQSSRTSSRDATQEEIDQRFYAIVTDLTGAPAELVAPDGTLAGYQQRTLWGGTVWHPSGASTPLRFPGQYADDETGLHYNNQRYYDPVTGAYLSPDPLGLGPAPNPHAYVSNPQLETDPLGLMKPCEENPPDDGRGREITLPQSSSYEQARNKALDLLGEVDPATRNPLYGTLERSAGYGKVIGFTTRVNGVWKQFRIDYDPAKGPHFNVQVGRGATAQKWAVPWQGTEADFIKYLKRLQLWT